MHSVCRFPRKKLNKISLQHISYIVYCISIFRIKWILLNLSSYDQEVEINYHLAITLLWTMVMWLAKKSNKVNFKNKKDTKKRNINVKHSSNQETVKLLTTKPTDAILHLFKCRFDICININKMEFSIGMQRASM